MDTKFNDDHSHYQDQDHQVGRQRHDHGHHDDVDAVGVAVVVPEDVRRIETHPGRPGNSKQQWQHWEKEIITEQIGRKLLSDVGAGTIVID